MKKRVISLLLLLSLIFSLISCSASDIPQGSEGEEPAAIVSPPFYADDRESFSDFKYSPPDPSALITSINEAKKDICDSSLCFEQKRASLKALEKPLADLMTMKSYSSIMSSRTSAEEYYSEEFRRISLAYPDVMAALDSLLVTLAASPDADRFEENCFGEGFKDKYDRSRYTEQLTLLLKEEADLEAEFLLLSKSNKQRSIASAELFIQLLKVRSQIASELGYESYTEYAYELLGHDQTPAETEIYLNELSRDAVSVYSELSSTFSRYFKSHDKPQTSREELINSLYLAYEEADSELARAYACMLGRKMYDVELQAPGRSDGSFTVYLGALSSPFAFVTTKGEPDDYLTLSHEFGHFYDLYKNSGESPSLDLAEVSSEALELLSVSALSSELSEEEYRYLYHYAMEETLRTLIFQSFYSRIEHEAYSLSEQQLTLDKLDSIVKECADEMNLRASGLSDIMIDHFVLSPLYVQSYATALPVSLEIFFAEIDEPGEGFRLYRALVEGDAESFAERLEHAGLRSPFEKGQSRLICDRIYYALKGTHFFKEDCGDGNAA